MSLKKIPKAKSEVDAQTEAAQAQAQIECNRLNEVLAKHTGEYFKLHGPTQMPVKDRFGKYRMKNFMPDDCAWTPTGAYVGKRDGIIIILKADKPADFATAECPLDQVGQFVKMDKALTEWIEEVPSAERINEKHKAMADNPLFGSW